MNGWWNLISRSKRGRNKIALESFIKHKRNERKNRTTKSHMTHCSVSYSVLDKYPIYAVTYHTSIDL